MPKASGPTKVELPFPLKGVSGDSAFGRVPEGMSPDALNVVGYDALGGRLRGGQRPGLSKYWTTALNGGVPVQSLCQGTVAVAAGAIAGATLTDTFTLANGYFWDKSPTDWDHRLGSTGASTLVAGGTIAANGDSMAVLSNALVSQYPAGTHKRISAWYLPGRYYNLPNTSAIHAIVKMPEPPAGGTSTGVCQVAFYCRTNPSMNGQCYGVVYTITMYSANHATDANKAAISWAYVKYDTTGSTTIATSAGIKTTAAKTALLAGTKLGIETYGVSTAALAATLGTVADISGIAGSRPVTMSDTTYNGWTKVGFGVQANSANAQDQATIDTFTVTNVDYGLGAATNKTVLAGVAGGSVYVADAGTYTPTLATSGSNVLSSSRQWIGAALNHGTTIAPSADVTAGVGGHQMIYYVDGLVYKRLDLSTSTVLAWAPDTTFGAPGTNDLPIDSANNTATIIATYRNRIVLSGLVADPQNWFMAAVGNPRDWNYAPSTTSATMAVAGNNSNAGVVGDVVTCLAPYSDDVMVMGGDHTIWVMRGDPAARGQIDNVSHKTGIVGPRAFAWDDRGNIHFFGSGRHWIMAAGATEPTAQSAGRMDREWGALDLSGTASGVGIQLVWDVLRRGLHIYATPNDAALTAKHWFWDSRADAYWPISYPAAMNPRAVLGFDATKVDDTALLIGGSDGYVRYYDPSVRSDDGTAISSYVVFRPILAGSTDLQMTHADIVLDTNTNVSALMQVYTAEDPQSAVALSGLRFARALGPGRTHVIGRAADNTLVIKLSNSTLNKTWAYESGEVQVAGKGHTMQGGRTS